MEMEDGSKGGYARKVHEGTRRFAQEILEENERLRALAATLQSEKLRLEEQFLAQREEIDRHKREEVRLARELAEIETENRRFSQRFAEVEQQNSNLVNLYVATYRLHGTLDRKEVLAVIQEIVSNLVGSEEMGIFELDGDGTRLTLASAFGIEPARFDGLRVGAGLIGWAALTGETYIAGDQPPAERSPHEDGLTACIPLKLVDTVTGVIAIFRLLPQKAGLGPLDRELFDLLATQAATALHCTSLQGRVAERPGAAHP